MTQFDMFDWTNKRNTPLPTTPPIQAQPSSPESNRRDKPPPRQNAPIGNVIRSRGDRNKEMQRTEFPVHNAVPISVY